jgi:hypothetical protein
MTATTTTFCLVDDEPLNPATPEPNKQKFTGGQGAQALGFSIADYVYFGYGLDSSDSSCGHTAAQDVYTFRAEGDLDGDGVNSTFELATSTDEDNSLYHARGFYIVNEIE